MSKKVGIYAGTFDPVHEGHVAFAREALEQCGLDKVYFLVEPRPRRKQGVRALEHRIQMVQLAVKDEKGLGTIVVEHDRFSVEKTLPRLRALFEGAELHMLMGEDVVRHVIEWPHVEDLLDATSFIIGIREGDEVEVHKRLQKLQELRAAKFKFSIFVPSNYQYTSSKIRLSLKRGHEPGGLSPQVRAYIKSHGLYTSAGE
jgi:nicotinate-nucleotide adenylyltransferase